MMLLSICFVLVPVRLMLETLVDSKKQSDKLKEAVDEKQQAQEKFQSILDKTPDIIYRLNKEGEITYISEAIREYGYIPEELIPHLSQEADQKHSRNQWTTFHVYTNGLYSDGRVSPESFIGTQGIAHDASKLKDIEKRIAFLASVVDQAAEDVIITDPRGVINYVNPKFEEITGYSRHEVIGKTTALLKSSKHNDFFFKDITRNNQKRQYCQAN